MPDRDAPNPTESRHAEPTRSVDHAEPPAPVRRARVGALEVISTVVDPGSFRRWDASAPDASGEDAYSGQRRAAAERSGVDESVITGIATIGGRHIAVVAGEFAYLAGSIGDVAAGRIVGAVDRATRERLPVLAVTASGGTRMQEGTAAFVHMAAIAASVARHRAAGLLYVTWLRHPTTGGVLASWGSLGQVTWAEPGALIGFLGPRVYEVLNGEQFPPDVQTAEGMYRSGLVDDVVPLPSLRSRLASVLAVTHISELPNPEPAPVATGRRPAPGAVDSWDCVQRSRRPDRPGLADLLTAACDNVTRLRSTGDGVESGRGPSGAVVVALATWLGRGVVVVGQDIAAQRAGAALDADALRLARRGIALAGSLRLPLVTVVDTAGAELSVRAERGGIARQIAWCLADLMVVPVPTVSVLLGQGSGGGALALLPADRVLAAQHGWLSPLPPEGASAILHRTPDLADRLAREQGVGSSALLATGVVDEVIAECPDAAVEPVEFCQRMAVAVDHALDDVAGVPAADRLERRAGRGAARRGERLAP